MVIKTSIELCAISSFILYRILYTSHKISVCPQSQCCELQAIDRLQNVGRSLVGRGFGPPKNFGVAPPMQYRLNSCIVSYRIVSYRIFRINFQIVSLYVCHPWSETLLEYRQPISNDLRETLQPVVELRGGLRGPSPLKDRVAPSTRNTWFERLQGGL